MTRIILCLTAAVACAGCTNDCEELCKDVTTCRSYCDPEEDGPDCDEESEREADLESCVEECEDAAEDEGERCEAAISKYDDCVVRHSCGGHHYCNGEGTQYFDECFAKKPGATSCMFLCNELEYGCLPFELFGYRGPDCEAVCIDAAKDRACSEALYEFEECQTEAADPVQPCLQIDSKCLSKAETFVERCKGFGPTTVDPDEEAFCADAAIQICLCDEHAYPDPACEPRTTDQCLFRLWKGETCRTGWDDYVNCLRSLTPCNNATRYENCLEESETRLYACQ